MKQLKDFIEDREGIIREGLIAVVFIISSSLIWLVGALMVSKIFAGVLPIFNGMTDPRPLATAQIAVNAYGISIIFVDVALLVWWGVSSQRTESQEYPGANF